MQGRLVEARFDALKRCVDIANEKEYDLFVVGGDLFDRVSVAERDIQRAASILTEFQGRVVAALPSNHDHIIQWIRTQKYLLFINFTSSGKKE